MTMITSVRTIWYVQFTREDDDDWPDMHGYASDRWNPGRLFRPEQVSVEVIRWPSEGATVYRVDVHGPRLLKSGSPGKSTLERGWSGSWPFPGYYQVPGWVTDLATRALDMTRQESDEHENEQR